MKTLNFNKKSWHYRVATKFGALDTWDNESDFCSYVRSVLLGTALMTMLTAIGAGLVGSFGDLGAWLFAMYKTGMYIQPSDYCIVAIALLIISSVLLTIVYFCARSEARKQQRYEARQLAQEKGEVYVEPQPSFIVSAYRSFKEKTCFKVQLN